MYIPNQTRLYNILYISCSPAEVPDAGVEADLLLQHHAPPLALEHDAVLVPDVVECILQLLSLRLHSRGWPSETRWGRSDGVDGVSKRMTPSSIYYIDVLLSWPASDGRPRELLPELGTCSRS